LDAMRSAIAEAHTLVFLGFAFHQINMELIKPTKMPSTERVFWTSCGISASDRHTIVDQVHQLLQNSPADI